MKKKYPLNVLQLVIILLSFTAKNYINAQSESKFKVSGYVDTYYAYDNDKNQSQLRQFSAIAPIRDEFRINLAQLTGRYSSDKVRGALTLQFGDIPKYNWPQSPNDYLQYIQEANGGFRPAKNLWVDFGYFLTHIGAEGIIPKYNFLSSMTLCCFYEPFYQSGIRVSYDFSDKFYGTLYFLNGYNVLADNNKNKSAGIQLGIKPNSKLEIIYNNIIGNEQPTGSIGKTRILNNLVLKYSVTSKLDLLLGADFVIQEKSKLKDSLSSANLFSGLLTLRYKITPKIFIMGRGEFYHDENGILSGTYTNKNGETKGLTASGFTFGLELRPIDNGYIRVDSRYLKTGNNLKLFSDDNTKKDSRTEIILTTGVEF